MIIFNARQQVSIENGIRIDPYVQKSLVFIIIANIAVHYVVCSSIGGWHQFQ